MYIHYWCSWMFGLFGINSVSASYLKIVPPYLFATPKQNNKMLGHEKCSQIKFGWMLKTFDKHTVNLMHIFMAIKMKATPHL